METTTASISESQTITQNPYLTNLDLVIAPLPEDKKNEVRIEILNGEYGWRGGRYLSLSGICSEADAHILHAAPDMYEALKAMTARARAACWEFSLNGPAQDVAAAQSALAKAEGRCVSSES